MSISTKLLLLLGAMSFSLSSQAIIFDGKYDGTGPYTKVFNFSYSAEIDLPVGCGEGMMSPDCTGTETRTAPGGILAFGTDGDGNQYVFFSHPLGYKDNSYDANSVGWSGEHDRNAVAGSEHFGFWIDGDGDLQGADNDYATELLVRVEYDDPLALPGDSAAVSVSTGNPTEGMHGVELPGMGMGGGTPATGIQAISTLQYNADQIAGGGVGSGAGMPTTSPAVQVGSGGCTNPSGTSGDDSRGTSLTDSGINNTGCYATVAPTPNWIFNAGEELQFTPGYFDVNFNNLQLDDENAANYVFDYFDFRAQIEGESFAIAHASPGKVPGLLDLVVDDTTEVPEPESLALFMLGLLLMGRQLRLGRVANSSSSLA